MLKNVQYNLKERPSYISSKEERKEKEGGEEEEHTWASAMERPEFKS